MIFMRAFSTLGIVTSIYLLYIIGSSSPIAIYILFALAVGLFDLAAMMSLEDPRFLPLSLASALFLILIGISIEYSLSLLRLSSPAFAYAYHHSRVRLYKISSIIALLSIFSIYLLSLSLLLFSIALLLEKPR